MRRGLESYNSEYNEVSVCERDRERDETREVEQDKRVSSPRRVCVDSSRERGFSF